jgi:hypothetical protein
MSRILIRRSCAIAMLGAALSSGCDLLPGSGGSTPQPPAVTMLPDLPGYTVVEGQTLTGYIGKLSGGAALLTGQPELAATLTAVDAIIGCYQQVGAVRARVYSNQAQPLSSGAVAIADRNALLDPANLFKCVAPSAALGAQAVKIEPCKASYTLARDGNEYYILYAGTTQEICQAFCKNLEGCTAHK